MFWQTHIATIVGYITTFYPEWKLVFQPKAEDRVLISSKIIYINKNHNPRRKLYILLHELGHVILLTSSDYSVKYKRILNQKSYSKLTYRVGIVEEEIDAWNEGEKVANKLSIPLDNHFYVVRSSKLASYMKWASRKLQ